MAERASAAKSALDPEDNSNKIIQDFLIGHWPGFKDLQTIKDKGWKSEAGDEYFKKQRKNSDKPGSRSKRYFFEMMGQIGREMNNASGALSYIHRSGDPPKFLDLCMAPGGFSGFLLDANPMAKVYGITLPPSHGGHEMLVDVDDPRVTVEYRDITTLSSEFLSAEADRAAVISAHPDPKAFATDRPYLGMSFDLVVCDGQVLRTHQRADYRNHSEATRLQLSQLILAMQRIKKGGRMVMLLHKLERWNNLKLLYTLSKFSQVQLFKPRKHHAIRSSFYVIAKDVQPLHPDAREAVAKWKKTWQFVTFDCLRDDAAADPPASNEEVLTVLTRFGERFVELGIPIWEIQREALEKSKFTQG